MTSVDTRAHHAFASDLQFEAEGIVSFTDETSLPGGHAGSARVVVAAQLEPSMLLDWYYDLIRVAAVDGELKSDVVIKRMGEFPIAIREATWRGVRHARLHIVDQREYRRELDDLHAQITGSSIPYAQLAHEKQNKAARQWLREAAEWVARQILFDSAASRLSRWIGKINRMSIYDFEDQPSDAEELERTLGQLNARGSESLVNRAMLFAARSSAAFSRALYDPLDKSDEQIGYGSIYERSVDNYGNG